ncbi:MAG: type II toxin-antitoxin system VapC family toxin [Bacteroidota bacterium]
MNQYLLDTNICIYYLKGIYGIENRIQNAGLDNCFISEITIAELKFGAANSQQKAKNSKLFQAFIELMQVIPIISCLDFYAEEKTRLRRQGNPIDEFDLLIGATAAVHDMVLVTNNEKHFSRITGIRIENWTAKA